jgi:hypothetical protein
MRFTIARPSWIFRVAAASVPKGTAYYEPNYKDFGPRVGLAWAPAMFHGKTTIRTGFGIYYGGNQNDDFRTPPRAQCPATRFPPAIFRR